MSAVFSDNGLYRLSLSRETSVRSDLRALVIGVNPSIASADVDDHSIRKMRGFVERAGFGRFDVGNLFAHVATDVRELRNVADPIGPLNDLFLSNLIAQADAVVVAWGSNAKLPRPLRERWRIVPQLALAAGKELQCWGHANDGHPLHPLTLGYWRQLQPWRGLP